MKEVFLIRHAEAPYDPDIPDPHRPLSRNGHRQAVRLADLVDALAIEEVHTSPYERCLHTIAPFLERRGLTANEVYDLRERAFTSEHVGDWATTYRAAWMDPDFAFADGESGREAQARMYAAIVGIVSTTAAARLAISSHGNVIALLLERIYAAFTFEHACSIRNPDVLRVTFDGSALRWDAEFALPGLDAVATTFRSSRHE